MHDPEVDFPLSAAKRAAEERLKASGMTYTIVRANYFMEVWLSPALGFDYPNARARIYVNLPRIDFKNCQYRRDIAAV